MSDKTRRPQVGEHIYYRTFGSSVRYVMVTDVYDDVKNGRAGFDCVDSRGGTYWGYDDQVIMYPETAENRGKYERNK
tara:strand:- start:43 stop:273 length:231 start_codon:yes stop_codon:yes gene_type:complete